LWVVATSVGLLGAVVVEWDTSSSKGESESVGKHFLVVILVKESGIVVVIDEKTKSINVLEMTSFFLVSVLDSVHGLLRSKHISDGIVHWVVEEGGDRTLIATNVSWVTVENLSHLEHSGSWAEFGPEVLWNLWDSINSNTIEAIGGDEVADPVLELLSNPVVFLVKIWEVSKSAVLNLPLVAPVLDVTLGVVVVSRVEWVD
jgi:hypothetical protein